MSARQHAAMRALLALVSGGGACGGSKSGLDKSALEDPAECKTCHPQHYAEWAGSMHAYAAEDPVFRAMNKRAQQENPATGTFCLQCHAPLAVRENLTQDGSNLDQLPASKRGVTCYFCHATASITSGQTHNNPLVLATDDSLYGPFGDPAPETPHKGLYSALLDGATLASATTCGSCHDIQNLQNAHVERTFQEWQTTVFAVTPGGSGCAQCHMAGRDGAASTVSTNVRRLHNHAFPAVDVAVTPFPADAPGNDASRAANQAFLDTAVQSTLCLNTLSSRLELTLDNFSAGHAFPSGATPDRRLWVELTAYAGDQVIYTSGGSAALPLEASPDPDLWLMRDCLYDAAGNEVTMFWQPTTIVANGLPGSPVQNIADPCSFNVSHVKKVYPDPSGSAALAQLPDRVTVKLHLQAIGDDVLDELVQGGFLDPSVPPAIARYDLGGGAVLEWTKATATPNVDPTSSAILSCVSSGMWRSNTVPAVSHARCTPPPASPTCKQPGT
jgi:hypothetical protein